MRKTLKICMSIFVAMATIFSITLLAFKLMEVINPLSVKKYIPIFSDDEMPIE